MSEINQPIADGPAPGKTSSEFIAVCLSHALAAAITILDLVHVHWTHGVSATQAAIPLASVAISALLAAAYSNHRTRLKIQHVNQIAHVYISELERAASTTEHAYEQVKPEIPTAEKLLEDIIPTAAPIVAEVSRVAGEVASVAGEVINAAGGADHSA